MATVYISGPISGDPNYKEKFRKAEEALKDLHLIPSNPATNPNNLTYRQYIDAGLQQLSNCDMILMLPGWEHSKGARLEHAYAETVGMPILRSEIDHGGKLYIY